MVSTKWEQYQIDISAVANLTKLDWLDLSREQYNRHKCLGEFKESSGLRPIMETT
jgi:hypothetical protein